MNEITTEDTENTEKGVVRLSSRLVGWHARRFAGWMGLSSWRGQEAAQKVGGGMKRLGCHVGPEVAGGGDTGGRVA